MRNFIKIPAVLTVFLVLPALCGFSGKGLKEVQTAIIEKKYAKAEDLAAAYLKAHPRSPQSVEVLYYAGLSRLYRGKIRTARSTFEEVIGRRPPAELSDRARLGIIDSYYLAGDYAKALSLAKALREARPDSPYVSLIDLKIARADLRLTRWDEARRYLERITTQFPRSPEYPVARQLLEEKRYFAVQVGSFLHRGRARHLTEELKARGEYAYIVETTDKDGRHFYRVRTGKLRRLDEARKLQTKMSDLGYPARIYP